MEARNGVGNFKADIEEVNSRIQGRAGTSLYIIAADGPATISREISEPLLPKHSLPFFTHRAYATRRARLGERTRHGVRGLGKGKSPGCFIWRPLSAICSSNQGCMNSSGVPESIGSLSHNSAKEKRDMMKSDGMK